MENYSVFHDINKSSFTNAEIVLPSAFPANFLVAAPITFPISAGDVAPTSLITAATSALNSLAESLPPNIFRRRKKYSKKFTSEELNINFFYRTENI